MSTAPASPSPSAADLLDEILVIDDEVLIRSFLRRGLSRRGLKVKLAEDAEEAKAMLEDNHRIKTIILDVCLAESSGIELLSWLQKTHPELRIVMMTGLAPELLADLEGIDGVLVKPFRLDDVLEKLRIE